MTGKSGETSGKGKSQRLSALLHSVAGRLAGGLLAAMLVFVLGVQVGSGNLTVPFRKTQTGLPSELDYSSVNQVYQTLRAQYDGRLTTAQLLDGMKSGMVNAVGDQYTEYFTPSEAKAFNDQLQGTFSGIGAQLGENASGVLEIIAPISSSPAAKAGLKAQDLIVSINGKSTAGMSVDTAVNAIRGPKGSKVTLGVKRGSSALSLTITRDDITVPSVTSDVVGGDIGYLQISQFSSDTAQLARSAAQKFIQQHVNGVILDLRDDPGGYEQSAIDVSSLWLTPGSMVLQEKRGSVVVNTYTASGDDILHGVPTIVLINGGSASSSEITAGALHDNHAATLVGEKSYGKGVVQAVSQLSGGAEMKVTTASWYRPDGENINKKGITPDKVVTLSDADAQAGNDTQKSAAIQILQAK